MKNLAHISAAALACSIGAVFLTHAAAGQAPPFVPPAQSMSFFVTSVGSGDGANLGGIAAADYHCQQLAAAVGSPKTFYAYLSTRPFPTGTTILHGRDRIGTGPWYNAKGALVAQNVADLHEKGDAFTKQSALTEKGEMATLHDILTGSQPNGRAYTDGMDHTCNGYTSNDRGSVQLGHSDRSGGTSWNSAHASKGCSQAGLASTGGSGLFYCFAID